jgi:hypothetical protein
MDDDAPQRIARNEATFREVNEALERGHRPGDDEGIAFRCECAQLGCTRLLELTLRDYEQIRANPRQFLVAVGHNLPEVETTVETHPDYVVVEKRDAAGRLAEATDPRA